MSLSLPLSPLLSTFHWPCSISHSFQQVNSCDPHLNHFTRGRTLCIKGLINLHITTPIRGRRSLQTNVQPLLYPCYFCRIGHVLLSVVTFVFISESEPPICVQHSSCSQGARVHHLSLEILAFQMLLREPQTMSYQVPMLVLTTSRWVHLSYVIW